MNEKKYWTSKTLWVNILTIIGIVSAGQFGFVMSPQLLCSLLGGVNILLRMITKEELKWK